MNRAERRAQVKYLMHKMHVSRSVAESMIGEGKEPNPEVKSTEVQPPIEIEAKK